MLEQCGYIMAVLQENRVETATKSAGSIDP